MILERLDRYLVNDLWVHLYPEASVIHLPRTHYDHSPPILNLGSTLANQIKSFRVESMWLSNHDFPNLIKNSFLNYPYITVATSDFKKKARD